MYKQWKDLAHKQRFNDRRPHIPIQVLLDFLATSSPSEKIIHGHYNATPQ